MRTGLMIVLVALVLSPSAMGGPRAPYTDLTFAFTSSAALLGELRGVEAHCVCGRLFAVDEWIDYTSPGRVRAFAFDPLEPKLYLVGPDSGDIRCVYFGLKRPLGEWTLYRHERTVADLAVLVEGGRSVIYFSSVDPASGRGTLFRLLPGGPIEPVVGISFDPTREWWDGFFSFDPSGALYLSSGGRLPGRLYRVEEGALRQVAQVSARRIGGFLFLDRWVVLYADLDGGVWKLDLRRGSPLRVYLSRGRFCISDLGLYPDWWTELSKGW